MYLRVTRVHVCLGICNHLPVQQAEAFASCYILYGLGFLMKLNQQCDIICGSEPHLRAATPPVQNISPYAYGRGSAPDVCPPHLNRWSTNISNLEPVDPAYPGEGIALEHRA